MKFFKRTRWTRVILATLLGVLAQSACQTAPPEPLAPGDPVAGRLVSERLCSSCHAMEAGNASPNPAAPPFPDLLDRYGPRTLSRDLENGVSISHQNMPTFYLGEGHGRDIVAFLQSLTASRIEPSASRHEP